MKKTLSNIKMAISWIYNKPHGILEKKYFEKIYKKDRASGGVTENLSEKTSAKKINNIALSYNEALNIIKKKSIKHQPQMLGTCVANSIKNAIRFAVKVSYDKDIDLAEGDIYIDRSTKSNGIDGGMYPDKAITRVSQKGIAIRNIVPTANNIEELKKITRINYPDNEIQPFRVNLLKGYTEVSCFKDFNSLWDMITNEYSKNGIRPFQFTIYSYTGWWGSDVPEATGKMQGTHSVVGVTLPFIYKGRKSFFAIDSAYLRGRVWRVGAGIRIVTEDCWDGLGISARKLEFISEIEKKIIKTVKDVSIKHIVKFGDNGENVENLQRGLISLGYDIPAITKGKTKYGYYGIQTAESIKKWQINNWKKFYAINNYWNIKNLERLEGKYFGILSVKIINTML